MLTDPQWTPLREYHRLTVAGVNPRSAGILSGLAMPEDDERAYWRQQAAGITPTEAARRAHARAQAARRAAARSTVR